MPASSASPIDTVPPVRLAPIGPDNWLAVARLALAPEQDGMLAPNVWSLAEAAYGVDRPSPRAVVAGDEIVGFAMYLVEVEDVSGTPLAIGWLYRFMVDARHQRRGYGTAALALLIDEMRAAGAERVRTMHRPDNAVAAALYARAGFVATGSLDDGDVCLELREEADGN